MGRIEIPQAPHITEKVQRNLDILAGQDLEIDKLYEMHLQKVKAKEEDIARSSRKVQDFLKYKPNTLSWKDMDGEPTRDEMAVRRAQIMCKCAEYSARLANKMAFTGWIDSRYDRTWHTRQVSLQLIKRGEVNIDALSQAVSDFTRGYTDGDLFNQAVDITHSYVKDGGKTNKRGSGLVQFTVPGKK